MRFEISIIFPSEDDKYYKKTIAEFMDRMMLTEFKFCDRYEIGDAEDYCSDGQDAVIVLGDEPEQGTYKISSVRIEPSHPLYRHKINSLMEAITNWKIFTTFGFFPNLYPSIVNVVCYG